MAYKKFAYNITTQLPAILGPLLGSATALQPSINLVTNGTTTNGYTLNFASTGSLIGAGSAISVAGVPTNTVISSLTSTTVLMSNAVTSAIASSTAVTFTPATVLLTTSQQVNSALVLFFNPSPATYGVSTGYTAASAGIPTGATVSSFVGNNVVLSTGVTAAIAENANVVFTSPVNTLSTNATSAISATVLNFATVTGINNGEFVTGTNIPTLTTVTSFTNTSVTISNPTSGTITNGEVISFSNIYTLQTALPTGLGTTIPMTSTAGVSTGQTVTGVNIGTSTTVSSVTASTVVLSSSVQAGGVGVGETLTFQSAKVTLTTNGTTGLGTTILLGTTTGLLTGAEYIESNGNTEIVSSVTASSAVLNSSVTQNIANGATLTFANAPGDALPTGVSIAVDSYLALDAQNYLVKIHAYPTSPVNTPSGQYKLSLPSNFGSALAAAASASDTTSTYTWTVASSVNMNSFYKYAFNVYASTPLTIYSPYDIDTNPNTDLTPGTPVLTIE